MTKVPIHYREKVNVLLERLIQVGIIREINIDDELGTFLDNPIIYLRKEKNLKRCVDSRFLNSFIYGLSGLPNFFSRLMALSKAPLIKTNQAFTYIDDTIQQTQNKAEMFKNIRKYHSLVRTAG